MKKCDCMCNFTEEVKSSSTSVWLFAVCSFLLGILIGFLFSPVKKGVKIGCDNKSVSGGCDKGLYDFDNDDDKDVVKF